ncbi:MAG: hypothetical protein BGN88_15380 [Clostridiales bacterium 43-6]|nr:MAG: hypothetical protein BGN88_15380 [Clostridiales bacterium 43-6]
MYNGDFRAYERTFSLLTQVVGRSGRGEDAGIAIIQTLNPENEIIRLAQHQDYEAFYQTEILSRKLMVYPPYCDIYHVGFSWEDREETEKCASAFFASIKEKAEYEYNDQKFILLGPSVAAVPKISNKYRYGIIIKCKNTKRMRELIGTLLKDYGKNQKYKKITISIDINPLTIH